MIERQNILDLIGRNKSKYSSCIITSFSFDFNYFEGRVMSVLRHANIKNVNVFVDGKFLEKHLEETTGNEFKHHKSYSLIPVYEIGVFHPKIMLLTGPKHGLLVIGSGNLTSSGLSTNDEVWGAFHLNSIDSPNTPLFAEVWKYLQQYINRVKGFNTQKLSWINQYSPWLKEIEEFDSDNFIEINKDLSLRFLGNYPKSSIYQQLEGILPKERIEKLTIISPYFDINGKVLENFQNDFDIDKMICITDSDFGLLPTKLNDHLCQVIPFYDWKNCIKEFDAKFNRLHAKIFQFEYENGWEYFVLGSANSTIHGLGSNIEKAKNGEASIVLKRKGTNGFLADLGISIKAAAAIDLRSFIKPSSRPSDEIVAIHVITRIEHAEINGNKLNVYFKTKPEVESELFIFSSDNSIIETKKLLESEKEQTFDLEIFEGCFKLALFKQSERISNFFFIDDVSYLSKTNPDPKYASLSQVLETLISDPENADYLGLFEHLDYAWVEDELDTKNANSRGVYPTRKTGNRSGKSYKELSPEEFDSLSSVQSKEMEVLNDPSVQIADLLSLTSKGLLVAKNDFEESVEEKLTNLSEDEDGTKDDLITEISVVKDSGELVRKAIIGYLNKARKFYLYNLQEFINSKSLFNVPNRPMVYKDLSYMSIALNLIHIFYEKGFSKYRKIFAVNYDHKYELKIRQIEKLYSLERIDNNDPNRINLVYYGVELKMFEKVQNQFDKLDLKLWVHQDEYQVKSLPVRYILHGNYKGEGGSNVKSYLIEMLGSYLINANSTSGFKKYEYESLNDKTKSLRNSIFERATFLCLNLHWKDSELDLRNILLLDLLHFVLPVYITRESIKSIEDNLISTYETYKKKDTFFDSNLSHFIKSLLPNYMIWKRNFDHDRQAILGLVSDLSIGDYVFSSKIGFAKIHHKEKGLLRLEKAGLPWDELIKKNTLKITYPGAKILRFA
ncbi:hypothetical protein LCM02_04810 [Lutimonas saemankumensis]|uniref:hypothetical protein n=1 Tax=Lutimonas saemankumensis TaxID=483016 RepID=UPI001CD4C0F4|nr:hypothetical protein [Lutimonas saemankumensis]MCA0931762.1 hypothetical protein [Lutimonas saemankumensis]